MCADGWNHSEDMNFIAEERFVYSMVNDDAK